MEVETAAPLKDESQGANQSEEMAGTAGSSELSFVVTFKADKLSISMCSGQSVEELKQQIHSLTQIPPAMQKLIMSKGQFKSDSATLEEAGVKDGSRIMLIGSTLGEVVKATAKPTAEELAKSTGPSSSAPREKLSARPEHKKQIERGVPEDAMPGIRNVHEALPHALKGMRNKHGAKLRLTFKLEEDQLWISTPERTEKVGMSSIQSVVSEPIVGKEEYHLLGLQLGPTEASRLWVYWVPAQYVQAIKRTIQ